MGVRQITLDCSEWDFDIIQTAIAVRQKRRGPDGKVSLCRVDEGSNFAAAVLAEICDAWVNDSWDFEEEIQKRHDN